MINNPLPKIEIGSALYEKLLPFCRLSKGEIWVDPLGKHKIACIDSTDTGAIQNLFGKEGAKLAIQDPPYNFITLQKKNINDYLEWSMEWLNSCIQILDVDSSLYVWLGADQKNNFSPFPEFINLMNSYNLKSRSFITMRNQRGYGTQKNWMSVRQELLYYTHGNPVFNVGAEHTDIPKILRGYYKEVGGEKTENLERGKSENIRAGNVWVDIQQVFYRMEENVSGCYAQKPLKAIERIIKASSNEKDIVTDFFSHSGTTLLASEILNRRCFTAEIDPVFAEITLRRLENYRQNAKLGWQNSNPFEKEFLESKLLI